MYVVYFLFFIHIVCMLFIIFFNPHCLYVLIQISMYVFTHQLKFSECENVKKLFVYVSKGDNLFNSKQKKQLKKEFVLEDEESELLDDDSDTGSETLSCEERLSPGSGFQT